MVEDRQLGLLIVNDMRVNLPITYFLFPPLPLFSPTSPLKVPPPTQKSNVRKHRARDIGEVVVISYRWDLDQHDSSYQDFLEVKPFESLKNFFLSQNDDKKQKTWAKPKR